MRSDYFTKTVLNITVAALFWLVAADASAQPAVLQVGMAKSFLTNQPKSIVEIATDDFVKVMKSTTGLTGELLSKYDAFELAGQLDAKKVNFALFHAHEFAWIQQKHPKIQALLVAVDRKNTEKAYLIVHKDSPAKSNADLKGKKLDMPVGTKEPCRVFLERICSAKDQKGVAEFYSSIEKSMSPNDALEKVAREKVDAAVVNTRQLEFFKEVASPALTKKLRVLQESEEFPPAVIAYLPGAVDQKVVDQFRNGLLKAHNDAEGKAMMKEWHFDAFEAPPADYAKILTRTLKAFPAPK